MVKTGLIVIIVSLLGYISAYISRPTPDDIVIHIVNKCSTAEEKAMIGLGLAALSSEFNSSNSLNPLASLVTATTNGRILFHQSSTSSWVTLEGTTIAYATMGMYKIPSCEQIRSFK